MIVAIPREVVALPSPEITATVGQLVSVDCVDYVKPAPVYTWVAPSNTGKQCAVIHMSICIVMSKVIDYNISFVFQILQWIKDEDTKS